MRPRREPNGTGFEPASFAWVKGNFDKVPPLATQLETRTNKAKMQAEWEAFVEGISIEK